MLLRNLGEVYKKRMFFMSTLYYRIEKLCKANDMTITSMCKESGASRASLSDLKMGRKQSLSTDTLTKIAKTLGVSVGLLIGHEPEWEAAIDKFGFCWDQVYRENKKAAARTIVDDDSYLLNHRIDSQIIVFKALFSRSLENAGYSLAHPAFPDYVAMILNQGEGHHSIPVRLFPELVRRYGKMPGIPQGTYYQSNSAPSIPTAKNIIPLPETKKIPLLGTIACGEPILAVENIEDYITVIKSLNADFALTCKGDSMINARIFDGDIVYIRQQDMVESGDIAAVLIDDEATLKRVKLYPDHIVLQPENPMYPPMVYWHEEMNNVRILGKAVAFVSAVR